MKIFKIPVEWAMYGTVEVAANTAEEALELFYKHEDELPLPSGDYVDDSFMVSCGDDEQALDYMGVGEDAPNIKEPKIIG